MLLLVLSVELRWVLGGETGVCTSELGKKGSMVRETFIKGVNELLAELLHMCGVLIGKGHGCLW